MNAAQTENTKPTYWVKTEDGRRSILTVNEDRPGVVEVSTEVLYELLAAAGLSRVEDPWADG